jgi:hypothetical protein
MGGTLRAIEAGYIQNEIQNEIMSEAFDDELGSFVQSYGSKELDASLLMLPFVGFISADDPKMVGTVAAIQDRLMVDGFVRRYDTASRVDGQPGGEGAFIPCTCWLADCLSLQGHDEQARELFERVLAVRNDVGLLSEEYDVANGRLIGNFPQAFSHVSVIGTARNLSRGMVGPAERRLRRRRLLHELRRVAPVEGLRVLRIRRPLQGHRVAIEVRKRRVLWRRPLGRELDPRLHEDKPRRRLLLELGELGLRGRSVGGQALEIRQLRQQEDEQEGRQVDDERRHRAFARREGTRDPFQIGVSVLEIEVHQ